MRAAWMAGLLLGALLAGCNAPPSNGTSGTAGEGADRMHVGGLVESDSLIPLRNATVRLLEANLTVATKADGSFSFPPLAPHVYSVEASLAGYRTSLLIARPDTNAASLDFVLQRAVSRAPRQEQFHFRGIMDCGFEAFIIAGACDYTLGVLGNQTRSTFAVGLGWNTTVIDVIFDLKSNPGVDSLRVTVRGQGQSSQLGSYQQYGHFANQTSFTIRLDPGHRYPGGTVPVTSNITQFQLDTYPQGRLYKQYCYPDLPGHPADCFLGVGAGYSIQFDLYSTVFYGKPAPAGFTLRTTG